MSTVRIRLYGIVQGVGFRPFVSRTANKYEITGTVSNKGSYVEVFARGKSKNLDDFIFTLKNNPPERAVVIEANVVSVCDTDFNSFEIIESEKEQGDIFVSPDIATCDKCRKELFDKNDRRYLHPFINCTNCGPRLTILKSMPYDRERTTMSDFEMCDDCRYEYTHSSSRRYDAQPVCCNECGPEVYIVGRNEKGSQAISLARKSIMNGKIIAVKGIGGFHLCCDAQNEQAVERLRKLKKRPAKPLAVMMKDIETVRRECVIENGQEEFICGYQKPILLLNKRDGGKLCEMISPDNTTVGIMLPYAPLQMLLFDYDDEIQMTDCLVMTSGNVSGAPICRNDDDAVNEIGDFCDLILSHNRQILLRADDSVMDWFEGKPYMIRRSRGFAPLPVTMTKKLSGQTVAVGGELKNTFCIAKNSLFYLSSYVGDMADIRTVDALRESVERMESLLEATPQNIVCDMHPKYNTVAVAEEMGLPVTKVQHHYAHILSCMAENDYVEKTIGFSYDGTGYGTDATIWGGEILLCDCKNFERVGSVQPFSQVGGDLSSKEGWRIAASFVHKLYDDGTDIAQRLELCDEKNFSLISKMADMKINSVVSTSLGRIFDGISAVLGIRKSSTFEGESSMALEFSAKRFEQSNEIYTSIYDGKLVEQSNDRLMLSTDELFKFIIEKMLDGYDVSRLAYEFHYVLSKMTVEAGNILRQRTGVETVALSGGVFQNKLLLKLCKNGFESIGMKVLIHSLVPANDGGISLGQALYSMNNI